MADREKYIDVLSNAVKKVKEYNEDTPIKISLECVEDILELLKEQELVRCKDCIHQENCQLERSLKGEELRSGDWFCGDAIRR